LHAGFWWKNTRERHHFEDAGVDGNILVILKWMFKK
jgi:hypothetical protein